MCLETRAYSGNDMRSSLLNWPGLFRVLFYLLAILWSIAHEIPRTAALTVGFVFGVVKGAGCQ